MQTLLIFFFVLTATLAGAILTTGLVPDAAMIFASAFTATLAAWTLQQYNRKFYPLTRTRILRPTLGDARREATAPPRRQAA